MAARRRSRSLWKALIVFIASLVVWFIDQRQQKDTAANGTPPPKAIPVPENGGASANKASGEKAGRFQKYTGCQLVDHRQNDGDSFRVRLPDGRVEQFRLYFVDCPESAFRNYGKGETNRARIGDQAGYFGITAEQAVEIGKQAKEETLELLGRQPFTVFTFWEDPFKDQRYHAIVQLGEGGWLHERLVRDGLVRIYTKPTDLPDGTPAGEHVKALREEEKAARSSRRGAWGL